jgi:hypothetical protein
MGTKIRKGYFHAFSQREARGGCVGEALEAEEFERIVHSSLDNDRRNLASLAKYIRFSRGVRRE